jgi:pteridine reductase
MKLENKKVLVTGGAVRIGRELCRMFAMHNSKIVLHCNSSKSAAEELFTELGGIEKGHILTCGDLTCQSYISNLIPSLGKIDILINNASVFDNKSLDEENLCSAREQYEINYWAPFTLMRQFRKQCSKEGLIINILDQQIFSVNNNSSSYLLSKKSLANATRLTALQWAPEIRVNGIAPGIVIPPVWLPYSKMQRSIASSPLKKPTQINEIANACIFLAENDSITGEIITLDGGRHLVNL